MARVLVYHPWIYLKSGLERTLLELARKSRHDIALHTSHYDAEGTYPDLKDYPITEHGRVSVKRNYVEVIKAALRIFGLKFNAQDYDILCISCDGLGPLLMFRNNAKPSLNLVFTPLRAVYDEEYRKRLMQTSGPKRLVRQVAETVFAFLDRQAWKRFDHVISISNTVTDRIVDGRLYPREGISLCYAGIEASKIGPGKPAEQYFFLPGRIMWTKNIELAVEAFGKLRDTHPDWRLVIAGMVDAKSADYAAKITAMAEAAGNVTIERDVTEARMLDLYDRCTCVVMSAFNEDQGLTPLEGAARGKPAIAVNRGGPRELILQGETGFLAEPDADSFAAAMAQMAEDPARAEAMGQAAQERVHRFTWDHFVDHFDTQIDALLAQRGVLNDKTPPK